MRKSDSMDRATAKQASHERIVAAAARAIRRSGYDGTGVAEIMKEAGLTHGAFYAHFASREAMLAEAVGQACAESAAAAEAVARTAPEQALASMLAAYLSPGHVANAGLGCPLAALGSETPRQTPDVRRATTLHLKAMVDLLARQSPAWGQPEAHEQALLTLSTMVGAVVLARLVDDATLSERLRDTALRHLTPAA